MHINNQAFLSFSNQVINIIFFFFFDQENTELNGLKNQTKYIPVTKRRPPSPTARLRPAKNLPAGLNLAREHHVSNRTSPDNSKVGGKYQNTTKAANNHENTINGQTSPVNTTEPLETRRRQPDAASNDLKLPEQMRTCR